jgi:NTP pyrophosphatase (non-canonical NTP hydrolase)
LHDENPGIIPLSEKPIAVIIGLPFTPQFSFNRNGFMELSTYQKEANKTAVYPQDAKIIYPALGLAGEAGEVANQVKKILRDNAGELTEERRNKIVDELGDVLWYAAALASDVGISLDVVAEINLQKLAKRAENGTLRGDQRKE